MAIEPGDANYICHLDSEGKKKARDELNEIESDRACAVQTFRKWVLEQDPWLRSPVDFEFLLRFLRVRKFSQVGARISLENFITSLTQTPEWFADVDPAEEEIQKIFKTGFYVCPLKLDQDNRRMIIQRLGQLDEVLLKNDSSIATIFRAVCLIANWLAYDENVQVHGLKCLIDWTNLTLQHATRLYRPENIKRLFHFFENSLPMRMKGLNMYNEPPFFDVIHTLVLPFMKEKTKSRIHIHGKNMTSVYKEIDQSNLPTEYLPDDYAGPSAGSVKQIVDDMIADMMKPGFRNYIKELTSSKYRVDLSQKPKETEPVATYRKLHID